MVTVKEFLASNANWHILEDAKLSFVTHGTNYQIWELISKKISQKEQQNFFHQSLKLHHPYKRQYLKYLL